MTHPSIPAGTTRSAFEQAGRIHDLAARGADRASASRSVTQTEGASPARPVGGIRVEQAIANASRATNVDFGFLVAQAQVESAMNPDARARTSSATGLYQFIESTWLGTVQRHGPRFGLDNIASQISISESGSPRVDDPAARKAILGLRNNPEIAALMAAGLAEDNRAHLAPILGRQPDHSELYLAHFLGAGGAGRFLSAMADDPNQNADALFRRAAAANRPVFYERDGSPRSLAGVMDFLGSKLESAVPDVPGGMGHTPVMATLGSTHSVSGRLSASTGSSLASPGKAGGRAFSSLNARPLTLASPGSNTPMSRILETTLDAGTAQQGAQVRRAYDQLKALGF